MNKRIRNLTGALLLSLVTVFGCTGTTGINPTPSASLNPSESPNSNITAEPQSIWFYRIQWQLF